MDEQRVTSGWAVPSPFVVAHRAGNHLPRLAACSPPSAWTASLPTAALVMVLCGASTLVPLTPGGAGTQQVMLAYALSQAATAAAVLSFSIGMQAGVTAVNALLGAVAGMVAFKTLRPWRAVRALRTA